MSNIHQKGMEHFNNSNLIITYCYVVSYCIASHDIRLYFVILALYVILCIVLSHCIMSYSLNKLLMSY